MEGPSHYETERVDFSRATESPGSDEESSSETLGDIEMTVLSSEDAKKLFDLLKAPDTTKRGLLTNGLTERNVQKWDASDIQSGSAGELNHLRVSGYVSLSADWSSNLDDAEEVSMEPKLHTNAQDLHGDWTEIVSISSDESDAMSLTDMTVSIDWEQTDAFNEALNKHARPQTEYREQAQPGVAVGMTEESEASVSKGGQGEKDRSRILRPRSDQPRSLRPRSDQPRSLRPGSDQPRSLRPRSDQPRSLRPRSDQPRILRPRSAQPRIPRPRSDQPRIPRPCSDQPRILRSHSDQPRQSEIDQSAKKSQASSARPSKPLIRKSVNNNLCNCMLAVVSVTSQAPSAPQKFAALPFHRRIYTGKKPHQCEECGRTFKQEGGLVRRIRVINKEKRYRCEECGETFHRECQLVLHTKILHTVGKLIHAGEKLYQDEECNNTLERKSILIAHGRIHKGKKTYQCEECGRAFGHKSHFDRHRRIHAGERPYQCEECGRAFDHKSHFDRHRRMHTGERPYQCEECAKAFSRNDHLVIHRKTHTKEKPYQCEECGKAFDQKSHFDRHRRIYRGRKKTYQCEECSKAFHRKDHLVSHRGTHTKEKPY